MTSDVQRTRRTVAKTGAAIAGLGTTAGCLGDSVSSDDESEYAVSMEPVGSVEFDAVPETWLAYTGDYADMGVALGQSDGLVGIGLQRRYGAHHYEELPGITVEADELTELWDGGTDKEVFYELESDVHVVDPNFMVNRLEWSRDDVDEIAETIGPFVGNTIFSASYDWHDYTRYSLYEAFEKIAEVFQERERYEAFANLHDDVLTNVRSRLPDERPEVAVLVPKSAEPEAFYPYTIDEGTQSKHWNDLRVEGAFAANGVADAQATGGTIDYEALLEIDPDVIAIRQQGAVTESEFEQGLVSFMREHDVASELRAVRNDRVIYGGMTYQGPIIHLFQLERAAQGLYPNEFDDEELFDRGRVADIVTGEY
ncbi:Fe3+-hydroxamate ABC transporter substrate-binding protein [Natrinema saccharevitans]|uniref:Fe3+-hydroxamate ABC transporter substrate-binding protein n=1 Tax=Natrinema saccharevitans TaxID=301967 RepID=A0A1S8AZX9_9EURY|nr:ABC transporter substrate-binding protein [Natrinema saccharevitans]OLZ42222.1 Fe3+-hydroxamate ABC transporter substrate-binding protein [Natrinema saccharevitans]